MKKSFLYLALGAISLSTLNSCEELENLCNIQESDLGTGDVFVTSLNHMVDIYKRVDAASKDPLVTGTGSTVIDGAKCFKSADTDTLYIDFGVSEVICADGKLRKGLIWAYLIGDYNQPNGEVSAELENYFVDGTQITGDIDAKNNGPAADPDFSITTTSFIVEGESNVDYTLGALWEQGFTTAEPSDDIFNVSGTVSGNDTKNNKSFSSTVIEPLHYVNACADGIEKGRMDIDLISDTTIAITIDFIESDGCNNLFEVSVDCQGSPISFTYPMN
jgi:hypothetical protein